ncbi:hypothetical protein VTI74DRAFT_4093 [Chaetomium olivicolor]
MAKPSTGFQSPKDPSPESGSDSDSDTDLKSPPRLSHSKLSTSSDRPSAFRGYRPFPRVMNLYLNYTSLSFKTLSLCGASQSDLLYLVELHFGYTPRGPLNFGQGFYLRNGTTTKDPILAAAGDEFPLPMLSVFFVSKAIIMLPPVDEEKNPRDVVREEVRAVRRKGEQGERVVGFRFGVDGVLVHGGKRRAREEFEWWKGRGKGKGKKGEEADNGNGDLQGSRDYRLVRVATTVASGKAGSSSAAAKSMPDADDNDGEVLAELVFESLWSVKHVFKLELKGAGATGKLGERWALAVVMSALSLCWMRQYGRTNKTTVAAWDKAHHGK